MKNYKLYTDVKQSRELAEILSHKDADATLERIVVAGGNLDIPEEQQYIRRDIPFCLFSGIGIPCWSLIALIFIINENYYTEIYSDGAAWNIEITHHDNTNDKHSASADNHIDACVNMILKLHEQNLM